MALHARADVARRGKKCQGPPPTRLVLSIRRRAIPYFLLLPLPHSRRTGRIGLIRTGRIGVILQEEQIGPCTCLYLFFEELVRLLVSHGSPS